MNEFMMNILCMKFFTSIATLNVKKAGYFLMPAILIWALTATGCESATVADDLNKKVVTIENKQIQLEITLAGGMFTGFVIKENPVNPFAWALTTEQMPENNKPFVFKGHFLCAGRWGAPTQGEIEAGIPHNGEVNSVVWDITENQVLPDGSHQLVMACKTSLEKLDVKRTITMPDEGSWFYVEETFMNHLPIGRPVNFVQHVTVSSPFLTSDMLVNTNASYGFDQETGWGKYEDSYFSWPAGRLVSGEEVDLQRVDTQTGFVTSHIFPETDSLGWITAWNPDHKLLLGYIFRTKDYPWLNYWNHWNEGKPYVRGLEFGTTGAGEPYGQLLKDNNHFFGVPYFEYLDAGEYSNKSWLSFQVGGDMDIAGVKNISVVGDQLLLEVLKTDGTHEDIKLPGAGVYFRSE